MIAAAVLLGAGYLASTHLKIGDLDPGAPELRADSRYNRDNAYITGHYTLSSDTFAVIVKTAKEGCLQVPDAGRGRPPGLGAAAGARRADHGGADQRGAPDHRRQQRGRPKWLTIARNQDVLNYGAQQASVNNPDLFNTDCSVMPVIAYLSDHRAETLDRVVQVSADFAQAHSTPDRKFLLAAGSAGIEAATNIVVRKAWTQMLLLVYGAVIVLCFITFRSWRAVVVAVVPLVITSVLCEALMVALGIGVKVATLPVIALGVGIGVDYALYLLCVQLAQQRAGVTLAEAYRSALQFTGKVVVLVGITLAAGVATWALSPIKFQADMGILLAFMFLWNMVGAVVLIPALSHFLLTQGSRPAAVRRGRPGLRRERRGFTPRLRQRPSSSASRLSRRASPSHRRLRRRPLAPRPVAEATRAGPAACRGRRQPLRAASIVAMSIFRIVIIASNARLAAARSGSASAAVRARGVICHDRPHLSLHQPHSLSWPPFSTIAFHRRSVSAWSSVAIWNENASLCLNCGPPFRPMQGMPITVNSTVRTSPCLPSG